MKTPTAILCHIALAAAQIGLAEMLDHLAQLGMPAAVQWTIQGALLGLQGYLAARNSRSDPNGNPLAEMGGGKYVTILPKK